MSHDSRATQISQYLAPRPLPAAAGDLASEFADWSDRAAALDPTAEARLLAEALRHLSQRLVRLHGGQ
jgi:hypothetical protein